MLQEIRATGVTRDFRRAWEGDSSDTWEDSEDNRNLTEGAPRIKRRRIPGEKHSAKLYFADASVIPRTTLSHACSMKIETVVMPLNVISIFQGGPVAFEYCGCYY